MPAVHYDGKIMEVTTTVLSSKPFRITVWLLLLFTTIWVASQVSFIFSPVVIAFNVLFIPSVVALILYYLISPVVKRLETTRLPRPAAILLVFTGIGVAGSFLVMTVGVAAYWQFMDLADRFPGYLMQLQQAAARVEWPLLWEQFSLEERFAFEDVVEWLTDWVLETMPDVGRGLYSAVNVITSAAFSVILLPIILYYLLKEREVIGSAFLNLLPDHYQPVVAQTLRDIDRGLAAFIQGQIFVSVCVGTMMYIGLLIIGLENALVLSLIGLITNFVPYLGPILGAIPAVIVGFVSSPVLGLQVLLVVVVVQQVESFLITPQVMGRKLAAHPLAIIFALILVSSLLGIIGLFIAMPLFVTLKIIGGHLIKSYKKAAALTPKSTDHAEPPG